MSSLISRFSQTCTDLDIGSPSEIFAGTWIGLRSLPGEGHHGLYSPIDGACLGHIQWTSSKGYAEVMDAAHSAFLTWRSLPAPKRGEIVRQISLRFREKKEALASLITYEMGKPYSESMGEVQEVIDMADFAVGLSRQLYGLTMHSERALHRMYEQYHPLGRVGVITAFNFPIAVWAWNAMIAWVCGNVCVWKPSEKTPLCAWASQRLVGAVLAEAEVPAGVSSVVVGDSKIGEKMAEDSGMALVSATGSVSMGRKVSAVVAKRLGRSLLELGGNGAVIVSDKARKELALRSILFGAIGTAGQRCTTTRRVLIEQSIYDTFCQSLAKAYGQVRIGNPLLSEHHMGPLVDMDAVETYMQALTRIEGEGGRSLVSSGRHKIAAYPSGCYVLPTCFQMPPHAAMLKEETFAPILYLVPYSSLTQAIAWQNDVPQGLSSAIITDDLREMEEFLSARGSDCGIANVNIGTSGAEIGGAFGGEKHTGGGREAGSDSWKAYMRRQTTTINYGETLPLAQGVHFEF